MEATRLWAALAAVWLSLMGAAAHADTVVMTGTIGNRAILIVNGGVPKTVAVGETWLGVELVALRAGQATVQARGGPRLVLDMDTPVSVGASESAAGKGGNGKRIVLPSDSRGHFVTQGAINGKSIRLMLDTGATVVSLSAADAQRIGLDYGKGQPVLVNTANGVTSGYRLRLASVRVGDVEVYDIEAIVSERPMPYALLGNSFINHFSMRRDADQMVLEKRF